MEGREGRREGGENERSVRGGCHILSHHVTPELTTRLLVCISCPDTSGTHSATCGMSGPLRKNLRIDYASEPNPAAVGYRFLFSTTSDDTSCCKAFTLQGEAHRHQGKPDRIYTGAYTKVQMSSLTKNRLKRRYTCWHHQRVMPNNYKYPGGSHNVRGE